jgi:glycosyltransferase involved in cell wall biosynthesis
MKDRRVLFINQSAGPLFRELAEDIAEAFGSAELFSGHLEDVARKMSPSLTLDFGPNYNRRNIITRAWSWICFFFASLKKVFFSPDDRLLFIVSNPPVLPLVGWLASVLRGQKYCILVYDLYPDVLIQLGKISSNGLVARSWRFFNRFVWSRAETVFTIGDYMAENIRKAGRKESAPVHVVPIWVDVDFIRPMPKQENSFLKGIGWQDRTIVLYSGNLGNTHNLDGLLDAARNLKAHKDLGFLIIGSGALWARLKERIAKEHLSNVYLLPFKPEHMLPQTLPSGDISIVSMQPEIAGYMFPSKTLYYMAAGSALMALVPPGCEVAEIVEEEQCGVRIDPDDASAISREILKLGSDVERLDTCKQMSRRLAVSKYSRKNTQTYIKLLEDIL